jgi:hypothetical protein
MRHSLDVTYLLVFAQDHLDNKNDHGQVFGDDLVDVHGDDDGCNQQSVNEQ